jgi:hypothetical protein
MYSRSRPDNQSHNQVGGSQLMQFQLVEAHTDHSMLCTVKTIFRGRDAGREAKMPGKTDINT